MLLNTPFPSSPRVNNGRSLTEYIETAIAPVWTSYISEPPLWQPNIHPINDQNDHESQYYNFRTTYLPNAKYENYEGTKDVVVFHFTFNHSVCDGMSLAAMMKKFHQVLNSIMKGEPVQLQPYYTMYPPRDYYIDNAIQDLLKERGKRITFWLLPSTHHNIFPVMWLPFMTGQDWI